MDYYVGSLSDLITGSNTANKKHVVRKKVSSKHVPTEPEDFEESSESLVTTERKKSKKKNICDSNISIFEESNESLVTAEKNKSKKKNVTDSNISSFKESSESVVFEKKKHKEIGEKKFKKRKLETSDESEPLVKRSKNDENAERRVKSKEKQEKIQEDPELVSRTVFVGNLPITSNTKKIEKFFAKFGKVEAVRIRGVPVANPKTPKKVAMIKKEFHPDRKSFFGYVRFENRDDAIKATEANGILFKEHHLRVHLCDAKDRPDENKAIFVGNLSFYAEEDDLWKIFESCGPISSVRIVRDSRRGIGKGFGYVNFKNSDSVTLALEMENVTFKDRELRISLCNINAAKKNKKKDKVKKIKKAGKPRIKKEGKSDETKEFDTTKEKSKDHNFQGVKFQEKKKKKFDKGLLKKKRLIKQIAPK